MDIFYRVSRINFCKTVRPAIRPNFPKAMQTLPLMFSQSIATKITKGTWHSARRKRSGERRTRVHQRMAMEGDIDNRVGEGDFTFAYEKCWEFWYVIQYISKINFKFYDFKKVDKVVMVLIYDNDKLEKFVIIGNNIKIFKAYK